MVVPRSRLPVGSPWTLRGSGLGSEDSFKSSPACVCGGDRHSTKSLRQIFPPLFTKGLLYHAQMTGSWRQAATWTKRSRRANPILIRGRSWSRVACFSALRVFRALHVWAHSTACVRPQSLKLSSSRGALPKLRSSMSRPKRPGLCWQVERCQVWFKVQNLQNADSLNSFAAILTECIKQHTPALVLFTDMEIIPSPRVEANAEPDEQLKQKLVRCWAARG